MLCALLLLAFDFESDVQVAGDTYGKVGDRTEEALTHADLAAAQKIFLEAVPETDRTAAHWFVLGNLWFDMDPGFAYRMHEKAFALAPTEPHVMREWALELHRAGNWSDASALYAKLGVGDEEEAQVAVAMRAECLLRLGDADGAVQSWQSARKNKRRAHLLHALEWAHGEEHPIHKRARIVGEIRSGNLAGAEELILTDVFWRKEGPRYFLKYEYMQADSAVVFEKLGKESPRAKDLWAVMDYAFIDWEQQFPRVPDATPRKQLETHSAERGWTGDKPRLPEHSRVARVVIEALLDQKLRSAPDLLSDFGEVLRGRATSEPADTAAAETLVWLAEKAESSKLGVYRALLPTDEVATRRAAVESARAAGKPLREPLVQQILAEIAAQKRELGAIDESFAALGKALESQPK